MWIKLGTALLTALVVVLGAEALARGVMGRVAFAHSYDEPRNPNYRRAWPAFTEPRPRDADEKLVIVISNSQGFAHELKDPGQVYTHLLEAQLNKQVTDTKIKVLNWSLGGVSGPEMLLLASRAADHKPDALLIITHSNPFSHHRLNNPLSFYLSDAGQLAYTEPIRDRLPRWYRRRHRIYDPATFLEVQSSLVQCRNTFVEQRHRRWHIAEAADEPRRERQKRVPAPEVRGSGRNLLKACVEIFHAEQPGTPVLLMNMPLCRPKWTKQAWEEFQSFSQMMLEIEDELAHVTAIDATKAIPNDLFLTHAHMSAQGHIAFADYLLPVVKELLEYTTAPSPPAPE